MSSVKEGAAVYHHCLGNGAVVGLTECCTGLGTELETTVDQTLIRGLITALRVFVSGLSSV
jgi:hypothetical protein